MSEVEDYPLTWITNNIAAGRAPMSYEEFDYLKELGINAIVNLCGEFSDLHELEEKAGFEVLWVPTPDETAPPLEDMEKGLEWLDEAVYLGKKVLVHCRHGIGRTGTFITGYLLRRGFGLKKAGKLLKSTSANPTNFSQWWMLRKFGKQEGMLTHGDPTKENRVIKDLSVFFERYEKLQDKVDSFTAERESRYDCDSCCSKCAESCCRKTPTLGLIEALYINDRVNKVLTAKQRQTVIEKNHRAQKTVFIKGKNDVNRQVDVSMASSGKGCPLQEGDICLLHMFRPIHCKLMQLDNEINGVGVKKALRQLSEEIFEDVFDQQPDKELPKVSYQDCISGKFIQIYFDFLLNGKKVNGR